MARFPWTTFSDFPLYIYQCLKSELKPRFEIRIETASILSTLASLSPIPFQMFPLHFIDLPRLKTPISSERVGSDFEWVPSSPRSLFNCNLREPLPSASSAAASACPFYFVNNNRIGNISSSFVPKTQFLP
ncbi:hypothetical protein LXL04_009149 [Taraxacum kok-saghyz]